MYLNYIKNYLNKLKPNKPEKKLTINYIKIKYFKQTYYIIFI